MSGGAVPHAVISGAEIRSLVAKLALEVAGGGERGEVTLIVLTADTRI